MTSFRKARRSLRWGLGLTIPAILVLILLISSGSQMVRAERIGDLSTGGQPGWSVAVSTDGSYVAVGGDDDKVRLYHLDETFGLENTFSVGGDVHALAICDSALYVAIGTTAGTVYLFKRWGSTPLWTYSTGSKITSIDITKNGAYIAAGSRDENVYLFRRESGTPYQTYTAPTDWIESVAIARNSGKYIAAASLDNNVYVFQWDQTTPIKTWSHSSSMWSVAMSSDGKWVACGGANDYVYLYDRAATNPKWYYQTGGQIAWDHGVAISANGGQVVAGSADDKLYFFTGKDNSGWNVNNPPEWSYTYGGELYAVDISSSGRYCAGGGSDGYFRVFRDGTGSSYTEVLSYNTGDDVYDCAFGGEFVASVSADGGDLYVIEARARAPSYSGWVGGELTSVNKLAVLAPYLALIGVVVAVGTVYVAKRRLKA